MKFLTEERTDAGLVAFPIVVCVTFQLLGERDKWMDVILAAGSNLVIVTCWPYIFCVFFSFRYAVCCVVESPSEVV